MEVKGRITKAGPLETRQRKDGSGSYTIFDVRVQIGVYAREVANYQTHTFSTETTADEIQRTFLHDSAREAERKYRLGEVVKVDFHHYINQYGRTETVIDNITPANAEKEAPFTENTDDLPF